MSNKNHPAKRVSRVKRIVFTLLPTILLLVVLALVETFMTLNDQGISTEPFQAVSGAEDLWRDNLDYPFKYHPKTRSSRQTIYRNLFHKTKPKGSLRGVVLGGSTAEGFPYTGIHGFSGILQESLKDATGKDVEVLNLGFSAMSSYYVRDAARKLAKLDLDLDFVVIYTGHNEYYGTISYASGKGHLPKLVNMRLKDWRIFQSLFNRLGAGGEEGGPTLMTRQFSQTRFPPDEGRDKQIGERFLDNLDAAVKVLSARGIRVLIVEPVSNLVDMPPFVSLDDPGLDRSLVAKARAVVKGDSAAIEAWLKDDSLVRLEAENPLAAYAGAKARLARGEAANTGFSRAKDLDPAPFRARSFLVAKLKEWSETDQRIWWVPLAQALKARLGPDALSHEVFIDHLHLNHLGQVWAAEAIARTMAQQWPEAGIDKNRLDAWFSDISTIDKRISFLRVFDLIASRRVAKLVTGPPYNGMALAYRSPGSKTGLDADQLAGEYQKLNRVPEEEMLASYGNHLFEMGEDGPIRRFLDAFQRVSPGSPDGYLVAGHYLASRKTSDSDAAALSAYEMSQKLAADPKRQGNKIRTYLVGRGRADLANKLSRP